MTTGLDLHSLATVMAYQLGELEGAERARFEAHLLACPGCVREFVELKRAFELAEGEPRPSPALASRVRRAVLGEPRWERPVAWLVALAAAAVIVGLVGTVGRLEATPRSWPVSAGHR